jgi:signal transduction histidine kinase
VIRKLVDGFSIPRAAFFWYFLVSIIAVLLSYSHLLGESGSIFYLLLFATVISSFAVLAIFLLQLINKALTNNSLAFGAINFLILIIIGAIRGQMMNSFSYLLVPEGVDTGNRLIASTITTLLWVSIIAISINSRNDFKDKFEGLISQALLNRFSLVSQSELAEEIAKIEADLKNIEISMNEALLSSDGFKQIAQEVDQRIQNSIRPLSHKLWLRSKGKVPRLNLFYLIRETITILKYPAWLVAMIIFFITVANLSLVIGLADSIARAIITTGVFVILHIIKELVQRYFTEPSLVLGSAYLTAVTLIPPFIGDRLIYPIDVNSNYIISALSFLIVPSLIFILSFIKTIEINRNKILDLIQVDVISIDQEKIKEIQAAQVASYLHNNLANEYRSIGRQIEQLSDDPHSPQARQAIEKLGALINRSISQDFKEFYESPILRLNKLPEAWRGILDLTLNVPEQVLSDSEKAVVLTQIIEELVSNTAAHLDATSLVVDVSIEDSNNIKIIALNNGQFIKGRSKGMGKDWINSISVSKVLEEQTKDGYKVTILI